MKIKRSVFLLLLIFSLFFEYGCKNSAPYDLSYREGSFCAEVTGNQFGEDIACDIYCDNGTLTKIVYSQPVALKNITVFLLENGDLQIEKNGISHVFSRSNLSPCGLLLPARRLLLEGFSDSAVDSVQMLESGFLLTVLLPGESAPISLTLDNNGTPSVLSGTDFSYKIRLH